MALRNLTWPRRAHRALALAVLIGSAAAASAATAPVPAFSADLAVRTFDAVWQIINDTYFDTKFNGVDWPAARDELRPKAAAAKDMDELRGVVRDLLGRLQQSHFALMPREVAEAATLADVGGAGSGGVAGSVGLEIRRLGNLAVVTRVDANGPAARTGVKPGWLVAAVGPTRVTDILLRIPPDTSDRLQRRILVSGVSNRFRGAVGSTVSVEFLNERNETVTLLLDRWQEPGETVKFGYLPPFTARLEKQRVAAPGGASVGVIQFNIWMLPNALLLDRAIDEYRTTDGMVIDLRGNPGGVGGMVVGIAGHFLKEKTSLGTQFMRSAQLQLLAQPRLVNPDGQRVEPYGGPVAVLIDGFSGSASELFSSGMQSIGRVRVFGEQTGGGVLGSAVDRLPNGDALQHAFADFINAKGQRAEGVGVTPDEVVPLSRADLLAGRDAPLDAALRWIDAQRAAPR